MVIQAQDPVAFVRLDAINTTQWERLGMTAYNQSQVAVVSIHVAAVSRGKGIAKHSLELVKRWATENENLKLLYAEIHPKNHVSQQLFTQAGYQPITLDSSDIVSMQLLL